MILYLDWGNGISRDRAEEIIAEEGMDSSSRDVGHIVLTNGGITNSDDHEAANLTSEAAFRAQVVKWREAARSRQH